MSLRGSKRRAGIAAEGVHFSTPRKQRKPEECHGEGDGSGTPPSSSWARLQPRGALRLQHFVNARVAGVQEETHMHGQAGA